MNLRFPISATILTTALLLLPGNYYPSLAGTCASRCGAAPLQFKPGQYLRVQIVNKSYGTVKFEQLPMMNKKTLKHGEKFQFDLTGEMLSDFSLLFWDDSGRYLKGMLSKPNFGTLVLEIRPYNRNLNAPPGDRSLFIRPDGTVGLL